MWQSSLAHVITKWAKCLFDWHKEWVKNRFNVQYTEDTPTVYKIFKNLHNCIANCNRWSQLRKRSRTVFSHSWLRPGTNFWTPWHFRNSRRNIWQKEIRSSRNSCWPSTSCHNTILTKVLKAALFLLLQSSLNCYCFLCLIFSHPALCDITAVVVTCCSYEPWTIHTTCTSQRCLSYPPATDHVLAVVIWNNQKSCCLSNVCVTR